MDNIFDSKEFQNTIIEQAEAINSVSRNAYQEGYKKGHIDASIEMAKTKKSFEEFLQDEFMKDFNGVKDQYESAYEGWLENLDVQEVMDLAEIWGQRV